MNYSYHDLQDKAFRIFLELLSKDDVKLSTNRNFIEGDAPTPAAIEQRVEELRTQAWALAKVFLDKGEEYQSLFPTASLDPQSTEPTKPVDNQIEEEDDDEPEPEKEEKPKPFTKRKTVIRK